MPEEFYRGDYPQAYYFQTAVCENPKCGLHIIAFDRHDEPICEIVLSREQTVELAEQCHNLVYKKVVMNDKPRK